MKNKAFLLIPVISSLLLTGCDDPASREAKYLRRGISYFQSGDYDKAEIEFKNAGRIKPTDPEVRYRLGLVFEARDDLQNAFGNFSMSAQQDVHYRPALLKLSEYLIAAGQTDEAEPRLRTVLADHPDDAEAHALIGAIALRQRREADAEREARFALDHDPADKTATAVLAGLYLVRNDLPKLFATLSEGVARNPGDLSLLRLAASAYQRLNDLPKLAQTYEAIFKVRPKDISFRSQLADLYVADGRLDEAEAVLRAGVAALPEDWDMKRLLIVFLSDHRGLEMTESEIRGYMKSSPDNDKPYFWLADLYVTHKAVDKAVALLQEVVEKNKAEPPGLNARTSLARISFARGDKDLARRLIAVVLEKSPDNQDALMMRASMAYDAGRYQGAVSDLRTVLRDHPRSTKAMQLLAESLVRQNHPDLAIDTLSKLSDLEPDNLGVRVRLAQMYKANGATERALDALSQVTQADPNYPIGWESTARIDIALKKWPEAAAAIDKLAAIAGQADTAKFLRGELADGMGKSEEATQLFAAVISSDPSTPLAEHALPAYVEASREAKRLDTAVRFLETLKDPTPLSNAVLGEAYLLLKDEPKATAAFDKAITAKINRPEAYLRRANLALRAHDVDRAIATLREGAVNAPDDLTVPMRLADLLTADGHYDEAIAAYDDVLNRDPTLDKAANNLAALIADYSYGDPVALDKARRIAERFQGSSDPAQIDSLAWVDYRQGEYRRAVTLMERAAKLAGDQLPQQLHYHFGAALIGAGQPDQAKIQLKQAVEGPQTYPGIDDAKRLLSQL